MLFAAFVATLAVVGVMGRFRINDELAVLRQLFEIRGPLEPPSNVVIVSIDDKSYLDLQLSPLEKFPRKYFLRAMEVIEREAPRVFILDLTIGNVVGDSDWDDEIERFLKRANTTIWSGKLDDGRVDGLGKYALTERRMPPATRFAAAADHVLPMQLRGLDEQTADGRARKPKLYLVESPGETRPRERVPLLKPLMDFAAVPERLPGNFDYINFYGPPGTIQRLSLSDLLSQDPLPDRSLLKDAIVLVGYQSIGKDRGYGANEQFAVPNSRHLMFGVEIHANVVGNLVQGNWLRHLEARRVIPAVFLSVLLLIIAGCVAGSILVSLLAVCALVAAYAYTLYYLFAHHNLYIPGFAIVLYTLPAIPVAALLVADTRMLRGALRYLKGQLGIEDPDLEEKRKLSFSRLLRRSAIPHEASGELVDQNDLREPAMLLPPIVPTGHTMKRLLGEGGGGAVYLAHDESGNDVALKYPTLKISKSQRDTDRLQANAERLRREFAMVQRIEHPNIVRMYELLEPQQGFLILKMEYVEGRSLRAILKDAAYPLSSEQKISIMRDVARALQYLHDRGLVHRDIKPENVLVGRNGVAKLADFGIGKVTGGALNTPRDEDAMAGTVAYLSPEQATLSHTLGTVDHRIDIYAFGVLCFELYAEVLPLEGDATQYTAFSHVLSDAPRLRKIIENAPLWLDALLAKCLQREPAERFQSMDAIVDELEKHAAW